jgi:hypothetical protein
MKVKIPARPWDSEDLDRLNLMHQPLGSRCAIDREVLPCATRRWLDTLDVFCEAPPQRQGALEATQIAWEHQGAAEALLHAEGRLEMAGLDRFARQVRSIREALPNG